MSLVDTRPGAVDLSQPDSPSHERGHRGHARTGASYATFRKVFLDTNYTLAQDLQPTWMGYSKGRWEKDTLVVETVGFNDKTWLDDADHPHSEAMMVTERYR